MDLFSIFQLCSMSAAKQLNAKRRRRPLARRLGSEYLEARLMLDATADFNAAIAAAQSLYATQQAGEDAAFQTTEQTDGTSFAMQAQGIGQGLQTDVTADDQALQSTADSADNTRQSQDSNSDQTDTTLNQAADGKEQQQITQAQQEDAATNASDEAQLASELSAEQTTMNSSGGSDATTFNTTMAADQTQTSSNISADQNAFASTLTSNDAQMQQADAGLQSAYQTQITDLAAATANQIGNASPSVDPAVAENDPGYQAALSQAIDGWNAAQQQAQNDITNGDAAADAAAAPLFQAASDQLSSDLQRAQNTYNTNVQNAQNAYAQAIVPFQQQLSAAIAGDQSTYNTSVQNVTSAYNSDMQTAAANEATRYAGADAAYNAAAQPLVDGYNSWLAGRTSQYQTDIATREAQLVSDLAGEDQTYNTTINGSATVPGLLPTEQSAIAGANSTYNGQISQLTATQMSEDAAAWSTYNSSIAGADQALANAQNAYSQTTAQIYNDAMQNNTTPDQSALDSAWNTLLAADHTHANAAAAAAQTLTTSLGADENEFVTNQKPFYVQKEDAVAAAEGAYQNGVAAAAKLRDDNDADHYASRDADEANITSGYNDDVATDYESLQAALVPLQQSRTDAYDDAVRQYGDDSANAWQKEQKGLEDAAQQQGNDDAAAYEAFDSQIVGPWGAEQNQIAAAEQQRALDIATASATFATATAAAQVQDMNAYETAYDTAVGDIESGLESYANTLAPAWAAAVIAASGNDPGTTTWANAWANAYEQEAADNASLLAQEASQQDSDMAKGLSAYQTLVGQINTENKNLLSEWGGAVVTLVSGNVGAIANYQGQALPQTLATATDEINAARTEAGKEIDAATQDAKSHDANDDQDAKDHDAHIAAYAQTVLPAGLADFTEVDDEVAADVGTLEKDAAGYIKQMDGAAVTEISDLATDGAAMMHKEAGATADYDIAVTAQQVTANNDAQTANVAAVSAAPDSQFAGESQGGDGYVTVGVTPPDPDSVMPDKDLPQPQGLLASFLSGVSDFARWLTSPFLSPIPGNPPSGGALPTMNADALAEAAIIGLFPSLYSMSLLSDAGYIPDTYMIGTQGDLWFALGVNMQSNLAIRFTGGSPLDWQLGLVPVASTGIKGPGYEAQVGIVLSAVQNCTDLNQLKGLSSSWGAELNPGLFGGGVAVSNIGSIVTPNGVRPLPFVPVDNMSGARPTAYSLSGSYGPSSAIIGITAQVSVTGVETITPREILTTLLNFDALSEAFRNYDPWDYWTGWLQ